MKPFRALIGPGPLPPPSFKRRPSCSRCGALLTDTEIRDCGDACLDCSIACASVDATLTKDLEDIVQDALDNA